MKKLLINLLFLLSITAIYVQCNNDDEPKRREDIKKEKTTKQEKVESSQPTKQELLEKIHGTASKYTEKMSSEGMEDITDEYEGKNSFYLDEEGYLIYYFFAPDDKTDQWIKIKPDEVKQEGNEIRVTSSTPADNIYWQWGKEWEDDFLDDGGEFKFTGVKVTYNTKTHRYVLNYSQLGDLSMENSGVLSDEGENQPVKWKASQCPPDYDKYKAPALSNGSNMQAVKPSAVSNGISFNAAFSLTGVKPVHVKLSPNNFIARRARRIFRPEGNHYVKFTPLGGDNYKVEFCDATGQVEVKRSGGTGFHGGFMPMKLYFVDVKVHYAHNTFSDAGQGNNYIRVLPCNDCLAAPIPIFLLAIIDPEGMESRHAQVLTTHPKGDKFYIEVKLNLPVDFTAQITGL